MEDRPRDPVAPVDDSVAVATSASTDFVDGAKDLASKATGDAKDVVQNLAEDAKGKIADQSRSATAALRETASTLDGELPWMGAALNKAADGFENLTGALNKGDVGQTLEAVTAFAKRQPALFLALSVAAGFALARIGKTAIEQGAHAVDPGQAGSGGNAIGQGPEL